MGHHPSHDATYTTDLHIAKTSDIAVLFPGVYVVWRDVVGYKHMFIVLYLGEDGQSFRFSIFFLIFSHHRRLF